MKGSKRIAMVVSIMALTACEGGFGDKQDKTVDQGWDRHSLSTLTAGIWIDPGGCQHWIIDDGLEGYLSARLDASGRPVCSDALPTSGAIGRFKDQGGVSDII